MPSGSCLCGTVSFTIKGELPQGDACHCIQCRKQSGHVFASCDVPKANLSIMGERELGWYASSEKVRRGFCTQCGSSLFWDPVFHDWIGIALGAIDGPTHTGLHSHIFVREKGDYYTLEDGVPQND